MIELESHSHMGSCFILLKTRWASALRRIEGAAKGREIVLPRHVRKSGLISRSSRGLEMSDVQHEQSL